MTLAYEAWTGHPMPPPAGQLTLDDYQDTARG